jgi:hypothetical protein
MKKTLLAAALTVAMAGTASAYTSYLMPEDFWPDRRSVTLQAAYATSFFTPAVAMASEFAVVMPDGSGGIYSQIEVAGESTTLRSPLPEAGTYRFTTGEQVGRVATMVGVDGGWRELRDGETAPEGAQVTTLQTVTMADAYVTLGEPTRGAVDNQTGRLALRPVTHPNQILVSDGFQIQLLFDGAPFPNMPIVLYNAGDPETDLSQYFVTDPNGVATLVLDAPGHYMATVRHRAAAPPGSAAAVQSYTTSLTFEAMDFLPEIVAIGDEDAEEEQGARTRPPPARRRGGRMGMRD